MADTSDLFNEFSEEAVRASISSGPGTRTQVREPEVQKSMLDYGWEHSSLSRERIERLYTEVTGRRPTEDQLRDALNLGNNLRLSDGDPIWQILLSQTHIASVTKSHLMRLNEAFETQQKLSSELIEQLQETRGENSILPKKLQKRLPAVFHKFFGTHFVLFCITIASLLLSFSAFKANSTGIDAKVQRCVDAGGLPNMKSNGAVVCDLK